MQHLVAAIAAVIVVVGEPSADPRIPAAADVLDDLAIVAGVDRGRFLFRGQNGIGGPQRQ